ncbi:MAG TPA: galactose-1-phosphate uridylyltransferase [Chryseosolibacter sp.]
MSNPYQGKWEKRWHPLREEWVVYSAHRNSRPWHGADRIQPTKAEAYDPTCYLCPGNKRVHGASNPVYKDVFIFENDHPVVGMNSPEVEDPTTSQLHIKGRASGVAKVICYDPRHNTSLSEMSLDKVQNVFKAFQNETILLDKNPAIKSILIFENRGEAVGVSNPHPHCQVYATDFDFKLVGQQIRIANEFRARHQKNLFDEIISAEQRDNVRIIAENENAIAFIPFFARYAYEVMIFPKKYHQTLTTFSATELNDLAAVFHEVVRRLDLNYDMRFPYVMSVMQAPIDGNVYNEFRCHLWLQPPFRQPGLIKFLAGPEIGAGNFMADTMPEEKAAELKRIDVSKYVAG